MNAVRNQKNITYLKFGKCNLAFNNMYKILYITLHYSSMSADLTIKVFLVFQPCKPTTRHSPPSSIFSVVSGGARFCGFRGLFIVSFRSAISQFTRYVWRFCRDTLKHVTTLELELRSPTLISWSYTARPSTLLA